MYKTVTDIWNAALAIIPHDRRIKDINEDSTEALRMRDVWDRVRHQLIARHEWGWLTHSTPLIQGSNCNDTNQYSYPRPHGVVRLIGLFDKDGRRVQATMLNHNIYSPCPSGYVRYLPDCENPEHMPPWFVLALVSCLAAEAASGILGMQTPKRLMEQATINTSEAIKIDSSEISWSGTDGKTFVNARR